MRRIVTAAVLVLLTPAVAWASNDPGFSQQWGIQRIGAEAAWPAGDGSGITIGVADTGADFLHEDLKDKLIAGHDYIDNDESPQDGDGHGTHVSGIAAAITNNGKGVAGVAPGARILMVRVLNDFGVNVPRPNPSDFELFAETAQGVRYAVDRGAKVVNMSLGSAEPGAGPWPELEDAIDYAWSKGSLVVIAAGNDSDGPSDYASGYEDQNAMVVVATTSSDARASYSNSAGKAKWGISAPGSSIYSTYYDSILQPNNHSMYATLSGTSMATPHVSGAAAVLFSMGLSPQRVVDRLMSTAQDLGPAGHDSTFGAGRLDLAKAVSGLGGSGSASGSTGGGGNSGSSGGSKPKSSPGAQTSASASPGESPRAQAAAESPASGSGDNSSQQAEEESGKRNSVLLNAVVGGLLVAVASGLLLWSRLRGKRTA